MSSVVKKVACPECGKFGKVIIKMLGPDRYEVIDKRFHTATCSKGYSKPKHFRKSSWGKSEKKSHKFFGVSPTAASGACNGDGDGRSIHDMRVEVKTTQKSSYRLTFSLWEGLCKGALSSSEEPVFQVYFSETFPRVNIILVRHEYYYPHNLYDWDTLPTAKLNGKSVTLHDYDVARLPMKIPMNTPAVAMTQEQFNETFNRDV